MSNQQDYPDKFRLLIDPQPNSGARNMAIDEMLLESCNNSGMTLRFYEWCEPTISLGYFQKEKSSDPRFEKLPHVRRLTGGGAILHHHELTYSLTVPNHFSLAQDPTELYPLIHHMIIRGLNHLGISSGLRSQNQPEVDSNFLCFGRGDENDILAAGHKVVGSAQRRRRGNVLQHGSLLIRQSEFAEEFPGLEDLSHQLLSTSELIRLLVHEFSEELSVSPLPSQLTGQEEELVEKLSREKYGDSDWNDTN